MLPEQITAGARTVAHMATYFDELKGSAVGLLSTVSASQRGYFTPGEDESVRQLLISYWQARAALLELVVSFRDDADLPQELRPAAFLVAYSAAILLVDAARFLREAFDDRPLVKAKLNEPEPHFGIPPCTYDTVQRSLTSVRHAWHLYHAMQYYDAHEAELRRLASSTTELAPALAVVDRLGDRVRVATHQFAKARWRVRGEQALGTVRRDVLGLALYGLQKLMGCLASEVCLRPGHRPGLPDRVGTQLRALARPGDVIIARKEHAVTNYFLPCFWPHAALYLGAADELAMLGLEAHAHVRPRWERLLSADPAEPRKVLEALKDDVWIRSVTSPLGCDSVVLLRPLAKPDEIATALARGLFHEGKPYDFDFDFSRSDRLVCTEVVYRSHDGIAGMRFELQQRAGRLTLSAGDLLEMALQHTCFTPVAAYVPGESSELTTDVAAEAIIARRLGCAAPAVN